MNINASLFGQMITFVIFIWFTMKYVWPPLTKALSDRQDKIAEGLSAAERGHKELELAQHKIADQLREAKVQANEIIDKANKRASQIVEEARDQAKDEGKRLVEMAQQEIQQKITVAKHDLRTQVAAIAVAGAERLIGKNLDAAANADLLDDLINEL